MKNKIFYVLLTLMLLTMAYLENRAYTHAKVYEQVTSSLVEQMSAKKLAEFQMKELAENFSFGLHKNDKRKQIESLRKVGERHKKQSQQDTLYFILLLIGLLGAYFLLSLRAFTFFGAIAAFTTLIFGLITPIMIYFKSTYPYLF